jgi:hypothetical protein
VEASVLLCVVSAALKLEAVYLYETLVNFCQTTQSYISKDILTVATVRALNHAQIFFEFHLFPTLSFCADFKLRLKSEPEE